MARGPKRVRRRPVGRASRNPVTLNTDIRELACARSMPKRAISSGISGGAANWARTAATLARNTTARISQGWWTAREGVAMAGLRKGDREPPLAGGGGSR